MDIRQYLVKRAKRTLFNLLTESGQFLFNGKLSSTFGKVGNFLPIAKFIEPIRVAVGLYRDSWATIKVASLLSAMQVGILDELEKEPKTLDELVEKLGTSRPKTEVLLDALCAFGYLKKSDGKYALSEGFARVFPILKDQGYYFWVQLTSFAELPQIIRTGGVSKKLNIYNTRGDYKKLLLGVNSFLARATAELIAKYPFENVKKVMVGSMGVSFASNLQREFPELEVWFGCYPHLIRHVPELAKKYNLKNIKSMKEHEGDPDKDEWGDEKDFDIVFLTKKLILKDPEEFGDKFVRKALRVLRPGGWCVIWEAVVSDDGISGPVIETILDLFVSFSGKRWKESEIRSYLVERGYRKVDIVPVLGGATTFVVAQK